jgi:hypothetical protein
MDVGIFYEIQVASPLKHREREYQVFHPVLDQVMHAEQAGFGSFGTVKHHFGKHGIPYFKNKYA